MRVFTFEFVTAGFDLIMLQVVEVGSNYCCVLLLGFCFLFAFVSLSLSPSLPPSLPLSLSLSHYLRCLR